MIFCNMFQEIFKKSAFFVVSSFCLFFVDNTWGWELFLKKPLVVYFDNFENTRAVAETLQERLGADIIRLESVVKYPKNKALFDAQIRSEIEAKNYFPALINDKVDLSSYDVIVVGTPVWSGRAMPVVISFLLKNNFTGKTVYFFSTYSGDAGTAIDEMKDACPNATYGSSLKVELKAPLNDERTVVIPNDIIKKWTTEIMAK